MSAVRRSLSMTTPLTGRAVLALALIAALIAGAALLAQQAKAAIAFKAPEEIIAAGVNGTPSDFKWPTSVAVDPVGRLVVATQCGGIYVYNNPQNPQFAFKISSIENHANQNFNGTPKPSIASFNGCYDASKGGKARQTTGITFSPVLEGGQPVMYVSHSDPEIFVNKGAGENTIYPASGVVSKLSGTNYGTKTDLVTGLARSGENHGPNGLELGPDGWLYLAIGGNTNHGGKSFFFSFWPETHHSGAVVKLNPNTIGTETIDVSEYNTFTYTDTGANPQIAFTKAPGTTLSANVPGKFELYSTGFRNPYDIVWHSNGSAYINENEGNGGFGVELTPGEDGCSAGNNGNDPGTPPDELHKLSQGSFHGHPNASRNECLRNATSPGSVGGNYVPAAYTYTGGPTKRSIVGIDEFKTATPIFDGDLQGQLIYTSFSVTDAVWRLALDAQGNGIVGSDTKIADVPAALDVTVAPNGILYVASRNDGDNEGAAGGSIYKIEPFNLANCPLPGNPQVNDSDSDGFTDGAETAAGTGVCNPADFPADVDGDGIPDAADTDDDNDGIPDTQDGLQLDASNGNDTQLPLTIGFNATQAGGFFGTGFPGVQPSSNGGGPLNAKVSGGAAGGFLGYSSTAGTNRGATNNQNNAMQVGFRGQNEATVSILLGQPYLTDLSDEDGKPEGQESGGLYIGPDEDNFISIGTNAAEGAPVIELNTEFGGEFSQRASAPLSLPAKEIVFTLKTNAAAGTVEGLYKIEDAAPQSLGVVPVPKTWLATPTIAGVFGTSAGSTEEQPFVFDDFAISGTGDIAVDNTGDNPDDPKDPKNAKDAGVKLTVAQLRINQRISAAAIRRSVAVQGWLDRGLIARDLRSGSIGKEDLAGDVRTTLGPVVQISLANPRTVSVAKAQNKKAGKITVSVRQLRINQKISAAAVRRTNALKVRLASLTGGDFKAQRQVGTAQLAGGLRIASRGSTPTPPASTTKVAPPGKASGKVKLTAGQLLINQKISQAAVRRSNALIADLEDGLGGENFADGSIAAAQLAGGG